MTRPEHRIAAPSVLLDVIEAEHQERRRRHDLDGRKSCDCCGRPLGYFRQHFREGGEWWAVCSGCCAGRLRDYLRGEGGGVPRAIGRRTVAEAMGANA